MTIGARIAAGFSLGLVVLVLMGAFSWTSARRVIARQKLVAQTLKIEDALDETLGVLIDSENASRGFALTGSDRYLEPMRGSRERLSALL